MIPKVPKVIDALHSASGGVLDCFFLLLFFPLVLDRVISSGFGVIFGLNWPCILFVFPDGEKKLSYLSP